MATYVSKFTGAQIDQRLEMAEQVPNKADKSELPSKVSDLVNDSGFISETQKITGGGASKTVPEILVQTVENTTAINTEKNRAEEAEGALGTAINNERTRAQGAEQDNANAIATEKSRAEGAEAAMNAKISALEASKYKVVEVLPETGETNVIYLVPSPRPSQKNIKDEFIWVDGAWEQIGSTEIDLSDYAHKGEVDDKLAEKANASEVYTKEQADVITNAIDSALGRMARDFGRYANPTEQVLQNATQGKYVDAVTGLAVDNSAYSISRPINLLAGDILLVPSASAVLAACSVVSRIVTNTYDKAILYTYAYDEQGRIATAKADYNGATYTAHYPDEETNTPDYWVYGAEHLTNLPTTHSVTESFYEPLVKQSVAAMPDEGYYVYLASRNIDVVISAFNATINGGKIIKVGWGIFKNIATNFVGHPQQRVIADYLCNLAERVAGIEDKLLNGLDLLKVGHLFIGHELGGLNVNGNMCLQGAGAPAEAILPINWDFATYGDWKGIPQFIGQEYVDTTNKVCYKACGVDAVSDWKRITNA